MEHAMSPRKPTLDDVDDTDDQDGMQQDEKRQNSDLKLRRRKADEVDLGGAGEPDDDDREGRR
jgi:hypothetical protein